MKNTLVSRFALQFADFFIVMGSLKYRFSAEYIRFQPSKK